MGARGHNERRGSPERVTPVLAAAEQLTGGRNEGWEMGWGELASPWPY